MAVCAGRCVRALRKKKEQLPLLQASPQRLPAAPAGGSHGDDFEGADIRRLHHIDVRKTRRSFPIPTPGHLVIQQLWPLTARTGLPQVPGPELPS